MRKLLLLLLLPVIACAGNVTATWIHPTTKQDGSALPLAQILSTRVEWGTCVGTTFGTAVGQVIVPAPATTTTINNLAPGTYCFHAATTTAAGEGGWSTTAQKIIADSLPGAPTLTVTVVLNFTTDPALDSIQLASVSVK
jgi:hypothetical protein